MARLFDVGEQVTLDGAEVPVEIVERTDNLVAIRQVTKTLVGDDDATQSAIVWLTNAEAKKRLKKFEE